MLHTKWLLIKENNIQFSIAYVYLIQSIPGYKIAFCAIMDKNISLWNQPGDIINDLRVSVSVSAVSVSSASLCLSLPLSLCLCHCLSHTYTHTHTHTHSLSLSLSLSQDNETKSFCLAICQEITD